MPSGKRREYRLLARTSEEQGCMSLSKKQKPSPQYLRRGPTPRACDDLSQSSLIGIKKENRSSALSHVCAYQPARFFLLMLALDIFRTQIRPSGSDPLREVELRGKLFVWVRVACRRNVQTHRTPCRPAVLVTSQRPVFVLSNREKARPAVVKKPVKMYNCSTSLPSCRELIQG